MTITPTREGVSTPVHLVTENLRKSKDYLAYDKLQDKSQWTGVAVPELDHTKSVIRQAGQEDVPVLNAQTKKWHFQAYANDPNYKSRAIPYTVGGVQEANPLAASDYPRIKTGTTQIVDVLANDSSNFGNNNGMTMTGVKLYNPAGEEVTQYEDNMATYRIVDVPGKNRKGIEITTKTKEGFAPTLSYSAVRSDGTVSSKGAVTLLIGSTTGKALASANTSHTKGEPAVQPANPDQVVTEKGEPATTEHPEFTGGVNAVEPAINKVPEYNGDANAVEADTNKKDDYTGSVNGTEPATRENDPEYQGAVNGEPATTEPKPEGTTPTTKEETTTQPTNPTNNTTNTENPEPNTTQKPTLIKGGHEQPTNTNTLWATAAGAITALAGALHLSRKKRKS